MYVEESSHVTSVNTFPVVTICTALISQIDLFCGRPADDLVPVVKGRYDVMCCVV